MIGEVSDWYVLNMHDELNLDHKRERRPFNEILLEARNIVKTKQILNEYTNESPVLGM